MIINKLTIKLCGSLSLGKPNYSGENLQESVFCYYHLFIHVSLALQQSFYILRIDSQLILLNQTVL